MLPTEHCTESRGLLDRSMSYLQHSPDKLTPFLEEKGKENIKLIFFFRSGALTVLLRLEGRFR
jgi:hypothetical protein